MTETVTQIRVHVRLFAAYREAARATRLDTSLPSGATVQDLLDALADRIPTLKTAPGLVAINLSYANSDAPLHDGDEVALIPPVSGGA
jgi:molybdopterin converting factor subunit 1